MLTLHAFTCLLSSPFHQPASEIHPLPVLSQSTALLEQKSYKCPTRQVVTFCKTGDSHLWLCLKTQNSPCLSSNPSTHKHSWALKGHSPVAFQVLNGKAIPGNSKETGSTFMNLWGKRCMALEMKAFSLFQPLMGTTSILLLVLSYFELDRYSYLRGGSSTCVKGQVSHLINAWTTKILYTEKV